MDAPAHFSHPLRLFWWKAKPNFGYVLFQIVVVHAGPLACDMFGLGSILEVVRRNHRGSRASGDAPWIWGTGLLRPMGCAFLSNVHAALLRGPIRAEILEVTPKSFGDPGLLVAEVVPPHLTADTITLVPHHSQIDDPQFAAVVAKELGLRLIDVRREPRQVVSQISACRHVVSATLHGLVVVDAYGIPSTWMDTESQGRLKYLNHTASVGRSLITLIAVADLLGYVRHLPNQHGLPYQDNIDRSRADLNRHFPAPLRAETPVAAI